MLTGVGLPLISLQELRHTVISLLLASRRATDLEVMVLAGHSSLKEIYATYGHVLRANRTRAADTLGDLLRGAVTRAVSLRIAGDEDHPADQRRRSEIVLPTDAQVRDFGR